MTPETLIPDAGPVLITGGTGFIGTALALRLLAGGVQVSVLTRDRQRAHRHFDGRVRAFESFNEIGGNDTPAVIVNLAGENLGAERWNEDVKKRLVATRVGTTRRLLDYIARSARRPRLLISGSAVGYYGARGDEPLQEESGPGDEFQSELCRRWEEAALMAQAYGVRVCLSRTGVVLGRGGGALSGLLPLFRKGLGAVAGSGEQWISWIHRTDLVEIFLRFMADDQLSGPFNSTSPYPVTNREFSHAIGRALHRPVWLRSPGWAMRLLYGEMAHLYLTGQRALPVRLRAAGFEHRWPRLEDALGEILGQSSSSFANR